MTHIDDLHGRDNREPEPDGQPEPLDIEDLQKLYDLAAEPGGLPMWGQVVYLRVPDLIAELREARQRIAGFEALEKREEWAWSDEPTTPPVKGSYTFRSADAAFRHALGRQVWRHSVIDLPWEPISPEAPF